MAFGIFQIPGSLKILEKKWQGEMTREKWPHNPRLVLGGDYTNKGEYVKGKSYGLRGLGGYRLFHPDTETDKAIILTRRGGCGVGRERREGSIVGNIHRY